MRLIDADALKQRIREKFDGLIERIEINSVINSQPTADVIPIEWIKEQKDKCFPYSITERELNDLLIKWERREDAEAVNTKN